MSKVNLAFVLFAWSLLAACHTDKPRKIQPATVTKAASPGGTPHIILTPDAKKRLGIESRLFSKDTHGKQTIPLSVLLYDNHGVAWVFVEASPLEFHREQVQVLQTKNDHIVATSNLADTSAIVIQGAAELNGTESGVGK